MGNSLIRAAISDSSPTMLARVQVALATPAGLARALVAVSKRGCSVSCTRSCSVSTRHSSRVCPPIEAALVVLKVRACRFLRPSTKVHFLVAPAMPSGIGDPAGSASLIQSAQSKVQPAVPGERSASMKMP